MRSAIRWRHAIHDELGWSAAEAKWNHAYAPSGTNALVTIHDLIRLGDALLRERALAVLRQEPSPLAIHAWFDAWCLGTARFDWWGGTGWGWDGVSPGQRACLRVLPERHGAVAVLANADAGRVLMRSVLREVVGSGFGVPVPPPNLEPVAGAAGDLRPYEGTYGWPDLGVSVRLVGDARGRVPRSCPNGTSARST